MPFIPHTDEEVREMLAAIGVGELEALFEEIPEALRSAELKRVPEGLPEMEVARLMRERAARDPALVSFAGGGAYDHHIPGAVWQLTTRGEYYSAYTPYQAEASQGTLQLVYEYQTMMSELTGLAVSNASLYDGASALAEAVLMAIRANRKATSRRVLMPRTVNPLYRRVTRNIVHNQGIELVEADFDLGAGRIDPDRLDAGPFAAVVVPQPNYFGALEEVDRLTDWAHAEGALVIGVVNPTALALLSPPGEWGEDGADICCGDGQPLGIPLSSGGPYFGFMTARRQYMRQLPGRIVGRTVDADGRPGYTLTLQAREQHIRRSKATSNICTNQGLMVTAATIYLALLGPEGMARVASCCHDNTRALLQALSELDGVERCFDGPFFHETAVRVPARPAELLERLAGEGILAGVDLSQDYPELGDALLVCATEMRNDTEIARYAALLGRALAPARSA